MDSFIQYYFFDDNSKESHALVRYSVYTITLVGFLILLNLVSGLLNFVYRHTVKGIPDYLKRYGDGQRYGKTWAVVTGGSDGIGLQFCRELAQQGFNICIVSRNLDKMKIKVKELEHEFPGLKTKCVVADFGKLNKMSEYEDLTKELKVLDIGVLILNAGVGGWGWIADQEPKVIEEMINVNALHPAYLSKALLSTLLARSTMSGIIITCSGAGLIPMPGLGTYSATKAFATYLGQGLSYELRGKIDVEAFTCGLTDTNMTHNQAKSWRMVDTKTACRGALRDLVDRDKSFGAFKHDLFGSIMYEMPFFKKQR